jgi:hypothetical protein
MASQGQQPSADELKALKERLKNGKLGPNDLKTLEKLVEHTEEAAKKLRAAIVE